MKRVFALSLLLSACTTTRPGMSYVTPSLNLSKSDAVTLATDTVQHLSGAFPPAKNTLVLDTPKGDDVLTPLLLAQLRDAGFGMIEAERGIGVRIRYLVSPLDKGVVLRLQYLTVEAARFYPRGAGGNLLPAAPFTVKEAK